jgi:ribonuclease-3
MTVKLQKLEKILGYRFKDRNLLNLALSHRSFSSRNNERLEFLGDSVLGVVVTEFLYQKFPDFQEGKLSPMRSSVVRAESLAEVGTDLNLGSYLLLGAGEQKSGSHRRNSILGDTVEAIIGAVYLDSGMESVKLCIKRWFKTFLDNSLNVTSEKDAKTALQEWLQQRGKTLPDYELIDTGGQPHSRLFTVRCKIDAVESAMTATSSSLRRAEQLVAELLIKELEQKR